MQDSNQNLLRARQDVQPSQRTLLQVEDNQVNVRLVEEFLAQRSNLMVLTARDGYEGFKMACPQKPDVILMDINMPGLGCLAALKTLRENPPTVHIPGIALHPTPTLVIYRRHLFSRLQYRLMV